MFFRDFSNLRNARRKLRVARLTAAQGRKAVKRLFHVAAVRLQCRQPVAIAVALHGFEAEPWLLGNRSAGKYPPQHARRDASCLAFKTHILDLPGKKTTTHH